MDHGSNFLTGQTMSNYSILVVDDDDSIREVLKDYLEQTGYQVTVCADGLKGLDMVKQGSYDIFILDIRLPHVNGIGLIKVARKINPETPIICITAYGDHPEKVAVEESADLVIAKPFQLEELSTGIARLLKEK